jgi:hypothetical protein
MPAERARRIKRSCPSDAADATDEELNARTAWKRRKRSDAQGDGDLLAFLDEGYAMEHATNGVEPYGRMDAVDRELGRGVLYEAVARGDRAGNGDDGGDNYGIGSDGKESVRAVAAAVLRSLRKSSTCVNAQTHVRVAEADDDCDDDLLQHLDASFEKENAGAHVDGDRSHQGWLSRDGSDRRGALLKPRGIGCGARNGGGPGHECAGGDIDSFEGDERCAVACGGALTSVDERMCGLENRAVLDETCDLDIRAVAALAMRAVK